MSTNQTVADLIAELQKLPQGAPIEHFDYRLGGPEYEAEVRQYGRLVLLVSPSPHLYVGQEYTYSENVYGDWCLPVENDMASWSYTVPRNDARIISVYFADSHIDLNNLPSPFTKAMDAMPINYISAKGYVRD